MLAGQAQERSDVAISLNRSAALWLVILANIALYNGPLLMFAKANLDITSWHGIQVLLSLIALVVLVSALILTPILFLSRRLFKWLVAGFALANAAALYFMVTYKVLLDRTMIGNIFNTDSSEAGELLHISLLLYVLLLGILPAALLLKTDITKPSRWCVLGSGLVMLVISIGWIYSASSSWLWFDKHAKHLGGMILPWGYVANTGRYLAAENERNQPQLPLPDFSVQESGPRVVVLVIGETARAANIPNYGYHRQTMPLMNGRNDVVFMHNPVACSTYTTASIKCMLSYADPEGLDATYEYLPSYLHRQDVGVIWRTNNWGEPPITVDSYEKAASLRAACTDGPYCDHDDVLLTGLEQKITDLGKEKVLVVLHQKGSHGPSYNKRYTQAEAQFTPVCTSVNLSQCSADELVNAYDNTLLHTDQFLNKTIQLLEQLNHIPSTMIYMSDHGESLGENGLYLHGTPYSIAPDVQKQIPMLIWRSSGSSQGEINLRSAHGHDLIFHSVMGALGLHDGAYNKQQDLFNHD